VKFPGRYSNPQYSDHEFDAMPVTPSMLRCEMHFIMVYIPCMSVDKCSGSLYVGKLTTNLPGLPYGYTNDILSSVYLIPDVLDNIIVFKFDSNQ
jgi:hypothetical protein